MTDANYPIVGIGASAGGVEALEHLFDHMPADTGCASYERIVVITRDTLVAARERQAVVAALTAAHHTPELVVAVAVAAVEVADAVGAAVGGRQPIGVALSRPAAAMGWADR